MVADGKNAMRKTLEAIALGALGLLFWITYSALYGPDPLPGRIPIHFSLAGQPNGWGSPSTLWLLPIVGAGVYLLITVVSRFPGSFHFPVRVTAENRPRLEELARRMILWLKAELVCLFTGLQGGIIDSARQGTLSMPLWLMPLSIAVIFGTVIAHTVAIVRAGSA
jgi:uncharacterized membrane protein